MNRRHLRAAASGTVLLAILALVAACAASSAVTTGGETLVGASGEVSVPAAGQGGTSTGAPADGPATAAEFGTSATGDGSTGEGSTGDGSTEDGSTDHGSRSVANLDQPLIVKTGTLQAEVADVPDALAKARAAIAALGGYVSGSEESNERDRPLAVITYLVPADRWDDALAALRALASKVLREQTQAVEVTGQVLDLGARIENLRVTERALQTIMEQATRISDVLEVQGQLTTVRGEIEELTTQKAHLEAQAALGTLTVTFSVSVPVLTTAAQGWSLDAEIDRAAARLVEFGQSLLSVAVWATLVGLPVLLVILLLAIPFAVVLRRAFRRNKPGPLPRGPAGPSWGTPTENPGLVGTGPGCTGPTGFPEEGSARDLPRGGGNAA
jgi:hypothetical protein